MFGNDSYEKKKHLRFSCLQGKIEQEISNGYGANAGIAKTKRQKQIIFVVQRQRWMQCILIRLKTHSARVASRHQLLWATAQLLVTCFSLIYLVDEFSFLLLEQRNEMRMLGDLRFYLFVSGVNQAECGREVSPRFPFVIPPRSVRTSPQTSCQRGGVI